jgi:hypothetical protein
VLVSLSDDFLEVRLTPWEQALGLTRSLRVARADIGDVRLVEDPMRAAMTFSAKVGMRIPWVRFIAHSIRFDEVILVSRREPGLSFTVTGRKRLRRALISAPDALDLVRRLTATPG